MKFLSINYLERLTKYWNVRIKFAVYDISLSYQATVLTSCLPSTSTILVCVASNKEPYFIPITSVETIGSSVYPNDSLDASFIALLISSTVTVFSKTVTNSVNEPVATGTL